MGHGRAVVVVAALEQEHGVERLGGRLAQAHAGGHGVAGFGGGSGFGGEAEEAAHDRDKAGQKKTAPRSGTGCFVHARSR